MLIDWFTVIAQLTNFLVLVWLLKRFLYGPILNAIDEREKRIANELASADKQKLDAQQQHEKFQQKNIEFEKHRLTRMNQVAQEAKIERERLLDVVRQESDALRNKLSLALKNEQLMLHDTLNQHVKEEVFAIARKTLMDLAETSLEERMANKFITRLDGLSDNEKKSLTLAFTPEQQPVMVQTAFDLPEQSRMLITTALNKLFGETVVIKFSTQPDKISGIEINSNGQKIGWSISDYLDSLTQHVNEVLQLHDAALTNQNTESQVNMIGRANHEAEA